MFPLPFFSKRRSYTRLRWRRRVRQAFFLAGFSLLGCDKEALEFRDTEGREFVAQCTEGRCTYRRKAFGEKPGPLVTLEHTGRLLAVCDSSDASSPAHCRAVTCTSACPPSAESLRIACEAGLCIDPERGIEPADTRLLCLAGTGVARNARQAERLALAAACKPPCTVPAACAR